VRLALLLVAVCALGDSFTGKVVGITDGDTLTVLRAGKGEKIRLYGIDAPERGQGFSNVAKQHLSHLVFGKTVRVEVRSTDRYQRKVADVFSGAAHINQAMVRAGYAWWFRRYAPRDRQLQALEEAARQSRRGLWEEEVPLPPWEFRRRPAPARVRE
jgi:micrococcal nuclease